MVGYVVMGVGIVLLTLIIAGMVKMQQADNAIRHDLKEAKLRESLNSYDECRRHKRDTLLLLGPNAVEGLYCIRLLHPVQRADLVSALRREGG